LQGRDHRAAFHNSFLSKVLEPLPELPQFSVGFMDDYGITLDSGYLIVTWLDPIARWLGQCLRLVSGEW
jgi:hypothetical protein